MAAVAAFEVTRVVVHVEVAVLGTILVEGIISALALLSSGILFMVEETTGTVVLVGVDHFFFLLFGVRACVVEAFAPCGIDLSRDNCLTERDFMTRAEAISRSKFSLSNVDGVRSAFDVFPTSRDTVVFII